MWVSVLNGLPTICSERSCEGEKMMSRTSLIGACGETRRIKLIERDGLAVGVVALRLVSLGLALRN